jgi:hypothetical protein
MGAESGWQSLGTMRKQCALSAFGHPINQAFCAGFGSKDQAFWGKWSGHIVN